jgi:nicotinamide riboside transporter PnuC
MITTIGIMSLVFNLASVYYATKNNIRTWVYGMMAAILTGALFLERGLMFSFLFQLFTLVLSFIGTLKWNVKDDDNIKKLNVTHTAFYLILIALTIGGILFIVPNDKVHMLCDLIISVVSIIATIMLLNHNIFAWIVFIVIDISYMFIALSMKDYNILIVYLVMFTLALYGFMSNSFKYLKISGKEESIFD